MRARWAWALACLTAVFVVADVAVTAAYSSLFSEEAVAIHGFPFTQLAVLGSALMGAVILSRYERHAVGVLLSMIGVLSSFSLVTEAYHVWVIDEGGPGPANLAAVAGWLSSLTGGQLAFAQLAVMFLLAPDGHFLSRRWRWAAGVIGVGALICTLVLMTMNPMEFDLRDVDVGGVRGPAFTLGFFMIAGGLVAALVSMWIRLRRSTGEERQQVRLIALAVAALVAGLANMLIVQNLNGGEQTWVASLPLLVAYVLLPVTFSLAALRYRLYDIEVVINRTVVLAVGFAFAALGYTTVVVAVGRLVDTRTSGLLLSLLATALVALAFQPLRRAVIRVANRIAYGSRAQPYEALSSFSRRLADTPASAELLPAVAEAAGRAVAARRATAALHAPTGVIVSAATWGAEGTDDATTAHVVPVRHGDVTLGSIEVDVLDARPLRPADKRLLIAIADQAAVAFRNTAMEAQLTDHVADLDRTTRQLAESRARILEADVVARRELEEAISHEVLPRLVVLPDQLRVARAGGAEPGPERARGAGGRHELGARGAPRADPGGVPDPARQDRHRARRSVAPHPDGPGAHAARRRLSGVTEVPGAGGDRGLLLLRRGDPPRPVHDGTLDRRHRPGAGGERARAVRRGPAAGARPGGGGRWDALPGGRPPGAADPGGSGAGGGPALGQSVRPERRLGDVGGGTGPGHVELVLLVRREQEHHRRGQRWR